MTKLVQLCLLETLVGLGFALGLVYYQFEPVTAFLTCMVMFLFGWINYEIGKEVKS